MTTLVNPYFADPTGVRVTVGVLTQWTAAEAYQILTATYDSNGVLATATVKWPDTSLGNLTVTTANATFGTIDAYTITHTDSALTVTQAAVTRNTAGSPTTTPALTVA